MYRYGLGIMLLINVCALGQPHAAFAQLPDGLIPAMTGTEISRRIFAQERITLETLRAYRPILDVYYESLWPDTKAQVPLGDSYILTRIDIYKYLYGSFDSGFRYAPRGWPFATLFGVKENDRKLRLDNGRRSEMFTEGLAAFLFIDPWAFDAGTYRLEYVASSVLGQLDCMVIAVTPASKKTSGKFMGTIWVDKQSFSIVRVKGTFGADKIRFKERLNLFNARMGFYLHFDCWRQQVKDGLWFPAYVGVDDNMPWQALGGDGETDSHYKMRMFVWGYSKVGPFSGRTPGRAEDGGLDARLLGLEKDGLVGPPGSVEQSLEDILNKTLHGAHLSAPDLHCRILLTTPIELFHLGNTILVSRGLLEAVPSATALTSLLVHELGHVLKDPPESNPFKYGSSLFEYGRAPNFAGLGLELTEEQERDAARMACVLLQGSPQETDSGDAAEFARQLAAMSSQVPNLGRARFGIGLVKNQRVIHDLSACSASIGSPSHPPNPLEVRGRYMLDAYSGRLMPIH